MVDRQGTGQLTGSDVAGRSGGPGPSPARLRLATRDSRLAVWQADNNFFRSSLTHDLGTSRIYV